MNQRAIRKLARLASRYDSGRPIPLLSEVEYALWFAETVADRRLGGYWPWDSATLLSTPIEHWTSHHFGWSFPCAEAIALIRRLVNWPCGRVIDVGAGHGLWTKVMRGAFGEHRVVALDPASTSDHVLKTTFGDWCHETGGPDNADLLFASWLPCEYQDGSDLGHQILDRLLEVDQTFIYVGSGPSGPAGTKDFHDRLGAEFDEYATEPLPRVYPSVFPRDFLRAYHRKP